MSDRAEKLEALLRPTGEQVVEMNRRHHEDVANALKWFSEGETFSKEFNNLLRRAAEIIAQGAKSPSRDSLARALYDWQQGDNQEVPEFDDLSPEFEQPWYFEGADVVIALFAGERDTDSNTADVRAGES